MTPDEELADRVIASLWARGMTLVPVAAWDDIQAEAARLREQLEAADDRLAECEERVDRLRNLRGQLDAANARLAEADGTIARLREVLYGGIERPADDPGQLTSIADWLDRVDDLADAELGGRGSTYRVGRTVQADLRRIASEIERLGSALDSMTRQFAYWSSRAIGYATGGLSALEEAFSALGWEDPHPAPEACCEVAGCSGEATTVHRGRRLCGDHWRKAELGEEADR